ncbi:MAG: biotin transporter BioY [Oscillibacter sp.]|jgi:biotin transport system substrate-specific component|nr:biotin transporter BioY [Oscillibacter sp.]
METAKASKGRLKTADLTYTALFAVLIAVCAWISIPAAVPFTMQTFAVFTAVGLLGGKRGTLSVLVYILLGAAGLPVFAGFTGGVGILLGSTGGYILGFLLSALLYWGVTALLGTRVWTQALGMVLGLAVCYAFGTVWFQYVYARASGPIGIWTALGWCVFPFILPDFAKIALALFFTRVLKKHVR